MYSELGGRRAGSDAASLPMSGGIASYVQEYPQFGHLHSTVWRGREAVFGESFEVKGDCDVCDASGENTGGAGDPAASDPMAEPGSMLSGGSSEFVAVLESLARRVRHAAGSRLDPVEGVKGHWGAILDQALDALERLGVLGYRRPQERRAVEEVFRQWRETRSWDRFWEWAGEQCWLPPLGQDPKKDDSWKECVNKTILVAAIVIAVCIAIAVIGATAPVWLPLASTIGAIMAALFRGWAWRSILRKDAWDSLFRFIWGAIKEFGDDFAEGYLEGYLLGGETESPPEKALEAIQLGKAIETYRSEGLLPAGLEQLASQLGRALGEAAGQQAANEAHGPRPSGPTTGASAGLGAPASPGSGTPIVGGGGQSAEGEAGKEERKCSNWQLWKWMQGSMCFPGSSIVYSRRGVVPIREVRSGDSVLGRRRSGRFGYLQVQGVEAHHELVDCVTLWSGSSEVVTATPDHVVMTAEGWKPIGQICVGVYVVGVVGVRVTSVSRCLVRGVYNLKVSGEHTYCVGPAGIVASDGVIDVRRIIACDAGMPFLLPVNSEAGGLYSEG